MRICGQEFTSDLVDRISTTVAQSPEMSRTDLARTVCKWLDWRCSSGDWQLGSCRKALSRLNRDNILDLPVITTPYSFQKPTHSKIIEITLPEVICNLDTIGSISIEPIRSRRSKDAQACTYLLEKFHYLGNGHACGASIRYMIKSDKYGNLGVLVFSSASYALDSRDKYIGWSENARLHNLNQVICNSRFLILPTVHVPNLASHVLSLVTHRLADDWYERYRVRPLLVETFVDPTQFIGTCYKAANWELAGQSSGRRDGIKKNVYLHKLSSNVFKTLCCEPKVILGDVIRPESASTWAEEEFGTVRLQDERLKKRLCTVAEDMYNSPQSNIPEACCSRPKTTAAYRFFANEKITMDVILTPHLETTIERIKKHPIVLAPQDTTTLDYSTHPATTGLGPTNTIANSSIGLFLHDTVAFTPQGTPLGVIDAQCWARDPDDKGKSKHRKNTSVEDKESMKWLRSYQKLSKVQESCPDTILVSIGDRESDMHDLFVEALKNPHGPKLLVRSEKSRKRKTDNDSYLWELMAKKEVSGNITIHLPKRGNRKSRDATVMIRHSIVELKPPQNSNHSPVKLWAVYLVENESSDGEKPIEWLLLTTAAVNNFKDAVQRVEWYAARWGIEIYHRTLKSGCRIKNRQLGTAERLEKCLAIDMVVAWRVYHLTMLGREVPELPCTVFFEDVEWKALYCYYTRSKELPPETLTLRQAILLVGAIGGHLGRKSDGSPGTQCIWRGLQRLDTAVEMYVMFTGDNLPDYRKSFPIEFFPARAGP